ncbi:MAG TPA: T9SS type A sorting domain-containing protein, partial [Flavipsychrobacter sp.]|nr:T9SS type A sorting domain-containing protein [Flavipsychrobacter sp.]
TPDLKLVLAGYENYASVCGFVAKYHLGGMQWPADANSIPGSNETFILAPNPTTSKLTITSGNKIKELSICNAMGQIAERQVLSGSERVTLDVAHLSPGIYYIKLTDETGSTHTGKFLKQ